MPEKIKIGISLRITEAQNYAEKRDSLSHDWIRFFEKLGFLPIFIPNLLTETEAFLDSIGINGLILSGGDSIGDHPNRDSTENKLINYGIKNNIPILGVCRGLQMINHFFGGTIDQNSSKSHVGQNHKIEISNNNLANSLDSKILVVNSFHNNIIKEDNVGENLSIFAKTIDDGTIEGIIHKEHKILGVMWHPEREQNASNQLILKNIFSRNNFWEKLI